jgi:malonate-semialdehyde dehydrogenase (acetylating)/methylmalonate-semialdehyde dehydrogenase
MGLELLNFIGGGWQRSAACDGIDVLNPATGKRIARAPLTPAVEVDGAAQAAAAALPEWRRVPATERAQYLFRLKSLLEANLDDLARTITDECGKTRAEAMGELRRGIENVEVACGAPILLQGQTNEQIAPGIDEYLLRQPVGVVAAITPFNFPAMIPLWFLPYALATGNCFILKPSDKTPITSQKLFGIIEQLGLPPGVAQLVNGARETVDALLDHPEVRAISLVGSTPVARYVYRRATAAGKRAQCQGGAKNPVVILPDADLDFTVRNVAESAFGCAGQRCLAASLAIPVGGTLGPFRERMAAAADARRVGYGMDEDVEMGPVIRPESKTRIEGLIAAAVAQGAVPVVDGRGRQVRGYEEGSFLFPTLLDGVSPASEIAGTEVFGPVLSLLHAETIDEALQQVNAGCYGNMASLFTTSGGAARRFRHEVRSGNVGINVGVAAPMAFYPFSGWRESFFGDLHAQGRHAIEFYTETKVVVERWPG